MTDIEETATLEDRLLVYFDRIVLCRYRSRPDLFSVVEDDMGGELSVVSAYTDNAPAETAYFKVGFGFRELADGRVCVAAFGPDFQNVPESEMSAWHADHIASPTFASLDPAFERWIQRNLYGNWNSEDGPLRKIEQELGLIQAMTRFEFGEPLFRDADNPALRYPVAENSEAYTLAQLELFRLVIDGLSLDVLVSLSTKLNVTLPTLKEGERRGTMNTLKVILPIELHETVHEPLRACSIERNKLHGVQPAHAFAAFKEFHRHAKAIHASIAGLRQWLECVLLLNSKKCLNREQAMEYFPRFDGPLRPGSKHADFQHAVGKTIAKIEAGEFIPGEGCHRREALVLHFTDGSALSIDVGSNAGNLQSDFNGLDASMFSADLIPTWAPNPRVQEDIEQKEDD
ncbi:MAG TPA: hypothetical protein VFH95_16355 [Candidatus Kapabacteria bacterium]|nr:hypothetical protein [Candidatus Kapabacteria bacterium]